MSNYLFISDAAKEVKVESHVLRYWEEELHLPIKRNELGHRYYTEEDVERFKQIKGMKERGLQLKAIKMILKDGKLDVLREAENGAEDTGRSERSRREPEDGMQSEMPIEIVGVKEPGTSKDGENQQKIEGALATATESREEKIRRVQWLLQQMIMQSLKENNRELCKEIKESVIKELDYQFRMQEEREDEREQRLAVRDEEYYKRMDELLRKKNSRVIKEKEKNVVGKLFKGKTEQKLEQRKV